MGWRQEHFPGLKSLGFHTYKATLFPAYLKGLLWHPNMKMKGSRLCQFKNPIHIQAKVLGELERSCFYLIHKMSKWNYKNVENFGSQRKLNALKSKSYVDSLKNSFYVSSAMMYYLWRQYDASLLKMSQFWG